MIKIENNIIYIKTKLKSYKFGIIYNNNPSNPTYVCYSFDDPCYFPYIKEFANIDFIKEAEQLFPTSFKKSSRNRIYSQYPFFYNKEDLIRFYRIIDKKYISIQNHKNKIFKSFKNIIL